MQYVNHFSHFLFLKEVYPLLEAAQGRPRVVSFSSTAHGMGDGNVSYGDKFFFHRFQIRQANIRYIMGNKACNRPPYILI